MNNEKAVVELGPKTLAIFAVIKEAAAQGKPAPTAPVLACAIDATVGAVPYHLIRLKATGKIDSERDAAGTSVRYYVPDIGKWTGWTERTFARRRIQ